MPDDISKLAEIGTEIDQIPVHINLDIIRLFSEGLYQSPHKAIEELVSNAYDADAHHVHVLLPEDTEDNAAVSGPLWVIDDGHGMDKSGFHQLWRIADSNKSDLTEQERPVIGQFGIGKLAAYVLANKLMHLSFVGGKFLLTMMNFDEISGHQYKPPNSVPISLREITQTEAEKYLAEIRHRDPGAWKLMFGKKAQPHSWTVAALSDFKDLSRKLSIGRLKWVLKTGLPLVSDFQIAVNGEFLAPAKETREIIAEVPIDQDLPGIGKVTGHARIFAKALTTGKSDQYGRSHGFFVRVRGRIINLEDELFGIAQPNHAAWSRFALEATAEGLRKHLLSSREGVQDSDHIREFRDYLLDIFNECRSIYEGHIRQSNSDLDIEILLAKHPSAYITDPLLRSVRSTLLEQVESVYIDAPSDVDQENVSEWLSQYENQISNGIFGNINYRNRGRNSPAIRYDPTADDLTVNYEHPFIDKIDAKKKKIYTPAKLFAISEVLLEGQLQGYGISPATIANILEDRDRILRLVAGESPATARQILEWLKIANTGPETMERAVGAAFQALGFKYEQKGGARPGEDGILYAHLGRHKQQSKDYTLVYDAKQTDQSGVPADKIDFTKLDTFRTAAKANYGFFAAVKYQGEDDPDSTINKKIAKTKHLALFKIEHLDCLVRMHYRHGLPLSKLRELFQTAHTTTAISEWIESTQQDLQEKPIPINMLLIKLEDRAKNDKKATPNVNTIRGKFEQLEEFDLDRLIAGLNAVEQIIGSRWIEVENSGMVLMHSTAEQIMAELSRSTSDLEEELEPAIEDSPT